MMSAITPHIFFVRSILYRNITDVALFIFDSQTTETETQSTFDRLKVCQPTSMHVNLLATSEGRSSLVCAWLARRQLTDICYSSSSSSSSCISSSISSSNCNCTVRATESRSTSFHKSLPLPFPGGGARARRARSARAPGPHPGGKRPDVVFSAEIVVLLFM